MGSHTSDFSSRRILDALRRIVRTLRLFDTQSQKLAGLTAAQAFVLRGVHESGGASINQLAALTHTDQSSVSVVVAKLAARKLIRRRRSTTDARRAELFLTPQGEKALRSSPEAAQDRLIAALCRMSGGRRAQLARLMEEWVDETGIAGESPALFFEGEPRRKAAGRR